METKNTAVLLLSCPDQKGIVASVSNFIFKNNGNILHADEHLDTEQNLFLMRVEWNLKNFKLSRLKTQKKFSKIVQKFQMEWKIIFNGSKPNVAIFVSKQDHCLFDLLYRYKSGELNCNIKLIISNHKDCNKLAKDFKIPFYFINPKSKVVLENESLKLLKKNKINLVILARYMQILSTDFIKEFPNKIINIHHSFLPAFIGAKPYHQAFKRGVKIIGATSHYVTEELDNGPIIEQDIARISHRDSVEDLVQKGKDLEKMVLARAVKWHLENRILVYNNRTVIFN